jgi:hypothetical protein
MTGACVAAAALVFAAVAVLAPAKAIALDMSTAAKVP